MAKNTIDRDIHFYRVFIGNDASGRPLNFDPVPVFNYIKSLAWSDRSKDSRYHDSDGKTLGCWIDSVTPPCKIRLGVIRRTDLPQLESKGELSPLEIAESEGLAETTHIVFFENNIVGCDYNFYGPRISRLPYYLSDKAIRIAPEHIEFDPILQKDVYREFKKFKRLTLLELRVRSSFVDTIAQYNDSLAAALDASYRAGETDDVQLTLHPSSTNREGLSAFLLSSLKALSGNPRMKDEADRFIIKGYREDRDTLQELNLLSDKLIVKRSIQKLNTRSRGLNSNAAFKAIISAYEELKDTISESPSLEVR